MTNQIYVSAPSATSYADGSTPVQLGGKQGDGIQSLLHGNFYTQASRGNIFYASNAAAGAAFSVYTATTFIGFMILNPQGSGKNLSLIRLNLGLNVQGSTNMGNWVYCWTPNWGTGALAAAGGQPWTAAAAITATRGSAICGPAGQGSSVAIAYTTATIAAASVFAWGRQAAFTATNAVITVGFGTNCTEDFDGTMIIPPGTIWTVSSFLVTGWTACATAIWEEVPL